MISNLPTVTDQCVECGNRILDKYFLKTKDGIYHVHCLRCQKCDLKLDGQANCYNRNGKIFCKFDYERLFHQSNQTLCNKCGLTIKIGQLVQRTNLNSIFHIDCFKCSICDTKLRPGQRYTLDKASSKLLFCERHFTKSINDLPSNIPKQTKKKDYLNDQKMMRNKRNRTSFKLNQLNEMKAYFESNKNPDSAQLSELAAYTGLQARVLRVWFQNKRAKCRRIFLQQKSIGPMIVPEAINLQASTIDFSDDEAKDESIEYCELDTKEVDSLLNKSKSSFCFDVTECDQYTWLYRSLA